MRYRTGSSPERGPYVRRNARRKAIAVLDDDGIASVGVAISVGRDADGVALWRVFIGLSELPGRWIVVDREFRSAEEGGGGR